MSRHHHPPAYLRYLKARLWYLARPSFWGTAIFLSVVGLAIKEYWTHPDFFTQWQKNLVADNKPVNSSVLEEDKAMTPDINNLPPVPYNIGNNRANPAAKNLASKQNIQAKNSKTLLEALNSKSQTSTSDNKLKLNVKEGDSTPVIELENPFLAQAQNLLQFKNLPNGSNSLGVNALTPSLYQQNLAQNSFGLGTGLPNQTTSNQNGVSESALQTALNQVKSQQSTNSNRITSTQKNPFEPSSLLSTENRNSQTLVPSTGFNTNTINPLNVGTGSTQSGAISGTSYIQPGTTPGTTYPQPSFNNLQPQNLSGGTSYIQPGTGNQLQTSIPGTAYPQPSFNNLQPQNLSGGTSYIQPPTANQLQTSIPGTAYPQAKPELVGIPQTPSAIPNRSAIILDQVIKNRLNNINTAQPLSTVTQPTSVPPSSNTLNAPNYTSNQGNVINNAPLTSNNDGSVGIQQAPAPVPQYIYPSSTQIPGQYTGGGQINRY
ncbi:hypothetical protein [Brasilonema bromeliae]|uniref:Uncharacterized protein n=1 Tax=Brasilonema bromeliae SPC951 TaxID=385972 RepID=A0ABX1PBD0_9CYAN|nr:hypothetical protein [Brasilonema bromeliae]NMG21779.1 hypothetical protein [Brasilonema bromeliae SPC951]